MKRITAAFVYLLFLLAPVGKCFSQAITVHDELNPFRNISLLPQYRDGSTLHQVSSYDTLGGNDDGFSGKYSFIRRNADSSIVIFEAKGPGVINRIWTPTPTDDTLDFYLDDTAFSIKYNDLFSGKVKPFVAPLCGSELGGNYCYYPLLFQDSCRIVCRAKKLQFHQIQWRSYSPGTQVVRSFPDAAVQLDVPDVGMSGGKTFTAAPSKPVTLFEGDKGGRIDEIQIYPASVFAGNAKDVWIMVTYDDDRLPAVNCPVADFFGFAFGAPSMQSWLLGTKNNVAYCRLPMPYDKNCRVRIINRGNERLQFQASVHHAPQKRDAAKEGKLFTFYNHQRYKGHDGPHELLKMEGRGHYVGTLLQSQGTRAGMTIFFEGDDSTVVDGELVMHGTGSEDYFNGGWYAYPDRWDDAVSLPLHGSLDYSIPFCRTGGYRFFVSDKIPFKKSFYHSIEHGPTDNNVPAIYTSLAFYYGEHPVKQAALAENTSVFVPDTMMIYPHLNNFMFWSGVTIKSVGAHDTGGLSSLYTVTDESRIRFSLEEIPEGHYELFMDYDMLPTGSPVSIYQRQTLVHDWMDTYSAENKRVPMQRVGEIVITPFKKTLTLQFATTKERNQFFLNRFIIVRK